MFFICLWAIHIFSSVKFLFISLAHFSAGIFAFFLLIHTSSFYSGNHLLVSCVTDLDPRWACFSLYTCG